MGQPLPGEACRDYNGIDLAGAGQAGSCSCSSRPAKPPTDAGPPGSRIRSGSGECPTRGGGGQLCSGVSLAMGISVLLSLESPNLSKRESALAVRRRENRLREGTKAGNIYGQQSLLCITDPTPPNPKPGRGTNSPGSKGSLNGHGVALCSAFHRQDRVTRSPNITRVLSEPLGCQALGASPLHALCRRTLRGVA